MNKTLCRNCIITAAVLLLPGCLAINAMLGVVGIISSGPIQYAGTAYSVGEYAYQYAVNDKTPDEVIGEKLAWLSPGEPEAAIPELAGYAKAVRHAKPLAPVIAAKPEVRIARTEKPPAEPPSALVPQSAPEPQLVTVATLNPLPVQRIKTRPVQRVTPRSRAVALVQHEYLPYSPDPLQDKLDRLEQAFRHTERFVLSEPESGVRLSATTQDAGQTETGVSGSWSIRHPVMQYSPGPLPNPLADGSRTTAPHQI